MDALATGTNPSPGPGRRKGGRADPLHEHQLMRTRASRNRGPTPAAASRRDATLQDNLGEPWRPWQRLSTMIRLRSAVDGPGLETEALPRPQRLAHNVRRMAHSACTRSGSGSSGSSSDEMPSTPAVMPCTICTRWALTLAGGVLVEHRAASACSRSRPRMTPSASCHSDEGWLAGVDERLCGAPPAAGWAARRWATRPWAAAKRANHTQPGRGRGGSCGPRRAAACAQAM